MWNPLNAARLDSSQSITARCCRLGDCWSFRRKHRPQLPSLEVSIEFSLDRFWIVTVRSIESFWALRMLVESFDMIPVLDSAELLCDVWFSVRDVSPIRQVGVVPLGEYSAAFPGAGGAGAGGVAGVGAIIGVAAGAPQLGAAEQPHVGAGVQPHVGAGVQPQVGATGQHPQDLWCRTWQWQWPASAIGAIPKQSAPTINPIDTRFDILFLQRTKAVRKTHSTAARPTRLRREKKARCPAREQSAD
jgi:hypothetical protein